jgi:NADP-dependent 3-hydroxy acid dehydrogenase YdfG
MALAAMRVRKRTWGERALRNHRDRYALKQREGIVDPDSIAQAYWQIHNQPRNAWTHETELRPWLEAW